MNRMLAEGLGLENLGRKVSNSLEMLSDFPAMDHRGRWKNLLCFWFG